MPRFSRICVLALGTLVLALLWHTLFRNPSTALADYPIQPPRNVYTPSVGDEVVFTNSFGGGGQGATIPGTWTETNWNGTEVQTNVSIPLQFFATNYTVYGPNFSSGENVSLSFINLGRTGTGCDITAYGREGIQQIVATVVDQLDGDLYMHGDFGPNGWQPGPCGFVAGIPSNGYAGSGPITVTLTGYVGETHYSQ